MRTEGLTIEEEAEWVVALLSWQLEMATVSGVVVTKAIAVIVEQGEQIEKMRRHERARWESWSRCLEEYGPDE